MMDSATASPYIPGMTHSPASAADRITSATGFLLFRVGDAARAVIERTLEPWGMRGKDLRALAFVCDEIVSQQDLCRLTGMDRTTMVAVVDGLERLGYAQRNRSPVDRRKHVISPTPLGRTAHHDAMTALLRAETAFLAPLDETERDVLNGALLKLYAAHDPTCAPR
ncbi:MAG: MarR family transcriptional regulator [Streptosporangiales bacterium]|nr:MarR family transcriptional regulator [Streptosporangiales bacterium]